jgi:hypothetical protein
MKLFTTCSCLIFSVLALVLGAYGQSFNDGKGAFYPEKKKHLFTKPSNHLAPGRNNTVISMAQPGPKLPADVAYGYNASQGSSLIPQGPVSFPLNNPASVTSIAADPLSDFIDGGTWINGNWYGTTFGDLGSSLVTVNTLTGVRTIIGSMGGLNFMDIAYDPTTGNTYGVYYNDISTLLYTINILTGTPTLIGSMGSVLAICLACNNTGLLYAIDIGNDELISVNKTTASVTSIGPIGFDANYAQGLEFDYSDNSLYYAAYNDISSSGELRTVNLSTGNTTLIGTFDGGMEVTGFAVRNDFFNISTNSSPVNGGYTIGGGIYALNTSCTLTANSYAGYNFLYWTESGNIVSTNASYTFTVTSGRILVANFIPSSNCASCPTYDFSLIPGSSWQTSSSSISIYGCKIYRFTVSPGNTYIFKTGCGNGATASFDTQLELYRYSSCELLTADDDGCESTRDIITWTCNYTATNYVYLKVKGYDNAYGNFTLAYTTPCNTPNQPEPITGSTSVCQGTSQNYYVVSVIGASSYTWTLPAGWLGASTVNSITATAGTSGGTISVTANNSCGSSVPRTVSVGVNLFPVQPGTISGNASVCAGTAQTYSILPVSGATLYVWTLPTGWTGTSNTTSITVTTGSASGNISVVAVNSCGTGPARTLAVTTLAIPSQPGVISGNSMVCFASQQTYSVASVSGATSYTWTLPPGWAGSSVSNSITLSAGSVSGTISVTANNSCGSSSSSTLGITVNTSISAPVSANADPASICQGVNSTISCNPVAPLGYVAKWYTGSCGGSLLGTGNSLTVTPSTTTTYYVRFEGTCGASSCESVTVTVSATVTPPTSATASPSQICAGSVSTLTCNPSAPSGLTAKWYTGSCTGFPIGSGNSIFVTPMSNTNYYVRFEGSCGNSACVMTNVAVNPSATSVSPTTAAANPPSIVIGSSTTLSYSGGTLASGAIARWYSGSCGGTLVGTGNNILVTPTALPTTYYVRFEENCGNTSCASVQVTAGCNHSWQAPSNMQNNMTVIGQILINGVVSTNPNDAIGAFVGTQCRGVANPSAALNGIVFLTIQSNNTSGETVTFKVWNSSSCSECTVNETVSFMTQSAVGSIQNPFQFHACGVAQTIYFPAGFTWFSVNTDRGSWALNTVLGPLTSGGGLTHSPAQNDRIIGQTSFATYYGTSWVGSLTTIDPNKMYIANFASPDTLLVYGSPVALNSIPIPAGYSWLGYLPQCNKSINAALSSISPSPAQNDRMISQTSFATYYGTSWVGSLATMVPGKGYKTSLSTSGLLTYPSCAKSSSIVCEEVNTVTDDWMSTPNMQYTMTIICRVKDASGDFITGEDFLLGAFKDLEVRGVTAQPGCMEGYFFLSVASNKAVGDQVSFKLRRGSLLQEINEKLLFDEHAALGSIDLPIIFTLKGEPLHPQSTDGFYIGNVWPNPVNEMSSIDYQLPCPARVSIDLFNCFGSLISNVINSDNQTGKHSISVSFQGISAGVYYLQFKAAGKDSTFTRVRRIIITD